MFVVIFLCFFFSQDRGETDCVVAWRERNETFIESFVIKCREADAIAGIQTVLFVFLVFPRDDVTGNEQLRNVYACQRTTAAVIGEYHTTKIVLSFSAFCDSDNIFSFFCKVEMGNEFFEMVLGFDS